MKDILQLKNKQCSLVDKQCDDLKHFGISVLKLLIIVQHLCQYICEYSQ